MSTAQGSANAFYRGQARVPGAADEATGRLGGETLKERRRWLPSFGGIGKLPKRFGRSLRGLKRRTVSSIALVLSAGLFVIAALTAGGFPAADLNLNDGGVWVTNRNLNHFGRFNRPIEQLDAMLLAGGAQPDIDLLQQESTVFLVDRTEGLLRPVDVSGGVLGDNGPALPAKAEVALGAGVVALLDSSNGKLWVRDADKIENLDIAQDPPTAEVGGGSAVAVGTDGTVFAVSSDQDTITSIPRTGERETRKLDVDVEAARITAVGDVPVVLGKGGKLVLPDDVVTIADGGLLQQVGPEGGTVLVATPKQLLEVDLTGGGVRELVGDGSGDPAAPVRLDGCVHAAWGASPPTYVRQCEGAAPEKAVSLQNLPAAADLVFRVNRDAIVLNDAAGGAIYLFERGGEDLGNWQELLEQAKTNPSQKPRDAVRDPRVNTKPAAKDDVLGARPGSAALLHVLDNDSDPDGDILIIRSVTAVKPAGAGTLSIVSGSQILQFTASPGDRTATVSFQYTIDDGRGGSAHAGVTVNVRPEASGNSLPHERPNPQAKDREVAQGGTITFNTLRDWRDDDGDPLLLVGADTASPDRVRFTPAGDITFTAAPNSSAAKKNIQIEVSDGIGTKKATVNVVVVDRDRPPTAENDLFTAVAGQTVTLRPLENDSDPNAGVPGPNPQRLRLTFVSPMKQGASATPNYLAGTIGFTASRPDTYYLEYRVTDGKAEATGRIRVDVRKASSAYAPVAVADQVALRGNGPAVVDVLANDVDLDGDILVVRSVEVPENSGLSVSVIEHRWLRIVLTRSDSGAPRFVLRYVVSDGDRSDTGVVTVALLPQAPENQRPVTVPDIGTVRAGDVVDVDVLANDGDPDGTALSLDPSVIDDDLEGKRGLWLVANGRVRFHAFDKPGTVTANYTARDALGLSDPGRVSVTIIAANAPNQIPMPPPIQARDFAGSTIRIHTPLTGVDPDGDSVVLLGPVSAPQLGRIVQQGIDFFEYEAYPDSAGTDVFTYRVQDAFGGRGTGTIRVGVVPFPDVDSAPVAVDDVYTVAPGTGVRVPVLANDSDVDGDSLLLEPLAPLNPTLPQGASVDRDRVVLNAGGRDGDVVTLRYGISDGRGQRATASIKLISKDSANLAPIARDDAADRLTSPATSVDVDVLANDEDLDGPFDELKIEPIDVGGANKATVTSDGKLRVPLTASARQVAYRLTDGKDASAIAFVRVPGTDNQAPYLRPDAPELEMVSGGELQVDLAELVADPQGRPVTLTNTAAISTSPSAGLRLVPNASTKTGFKLAAAANFRGQAAVVFEVENGSATASLSVKVKVTPSGTTPPVLACPPAEPAAGAPAVLVNLARCVRGGGADGMTFRMTGQAPQGVTARLAGTVLEISATPDAEIGDRGKIALSVTDAKGASANGTIAIVVRPSGLAVAVADTVDAEVGREMTINVVANDLNPFPSSPLKLISVDSDLPGLRFDEGTGDVVFTPAKHGKFTARYVIQDITGKPDRRVSGQLLVTVIDKPTAPGQPVARSVGDEFAVLVWSEPDSRGSRIDGYTVTGSSGFKQTCTGTVCRLTGLTNGRDYRFKVRAHNEAGDGPESSESAVVKPDAKPDAPDAPTTTFGDSSIKLAWAAPSSNGGSAIKEYDVEISPGGTIRTVTTTSYTWTGLTNGAAYTFRVLARNKNLESGFSPSSAPEIPAKAPDAPQAPTGSGVADGVGEQIVVDWVEPPVNGAAITQYRLTVVRAGVVERTINVNGDTTRTTISADNGVNYQFRLVAVNKAGPSQQSPLSAVTVAHGKPFPVTAHSYSDNSGGTGLDGRVTYSLSPPNDNGMAIARYEFDVDGNGTADRSDTGSTGSVTGLANGTSYQIRVRACNDVCGNWSGAGNSVTPYGPVPRPNAGASKLGATQVRLSWSSGGTNGRPLNRVEYRVNGGGWVNGGTSGSVDVGNGNNQTWSIDVRAFDSAGQVSPTASASATTDPPTPPTVTVEKGGSAVGQPGCSAPSCAFIVATLTNFAGGTAYTCSINSSQGALGSVTVTTNGSGNGSRQSLSYFGFPTGWVSVTCAGNTGRRDPWGN
ncbi:hypothetical protein F4553_007503 [Allocatelliglobosispora scoriae]|uniref:Fibronectin type-III domain-containing protein n=1 Tax=Allocatelliglobosispora scoriae TaxID=643052 RepID=A0A841C435_9ACTN|nr:Ig-like domain-containing protein [Allocatelliglobosispora scoriae]MBB5874069.1 hypothetical protein [Allocatelliglobosispora scoriae]